MNKYRRIKYEDRCQIYALSKRGSSLNSGRSERSAGMIRLVGLRGLENVAAECDRWWPLRELPLRLQER
jgi:hypothetical protein